MTGRSKVRNAELEATLKDRETDASRWGDKIALGYMKIVNAKDKRIAELEATLAQNIKDSEATCELYKAGRDQRAASAEQLVVQLAGCSVAASGWSAKDPAKQGDYGWSQSYQDVLDLRTKYDQLAASLETARKALGYIKGDTDEEDTRSRASKALAQIAKPAAAQKCPICETSYKPCPYHPKHIGVDERAVAASDHFRDTAKMVAPDGKDGKDAQHDGELVIKERICLE